MSASQTSGPPSEQTIISHILISTLGTDWFTLVQYHVLGIALGFCVFGWNALLAAQFFSSRNFKNEGWVAKVVVCTMMTLLVGHLSSNFYDIWAIIGYGPDRGFQCVSSRFNEQFDIDEKIIFTEIIFMGVLMAPISLSFIGYRTWKLYGRSKIFGVVGVLGIAGMITAAILAVAHSFTLPIHGNDSLVEIQTNYHPSWGAAMGRRMLAFVCTDIAINSCLTIANLLKFQRLRSDDYGNSGIVKKLFIMTLESLLPSAIANIGLGICYIRGGEIGKAARQISHIQPGLYTLACLTSVTAKSGLQNSLLVNNMSMRVPTEFRGVNELGVDLSGSGSGSGSEGMATTQYSGGSDLKGTTITQESNFMNALTSGPTEEEEKVKRSGRFLGVAFGRGKVVLSDQEKGVLE